MVYLQEILTSDLQVKKSKNGFNSKNISPNNDLLIKITNQIDLNSNLEEDQQYYLNSITPPLDSDYFCSNNLNSNIEEKNNYLITDYKILELPDSPDSLNSTNKKFKSNLSSNSIKLNSNNFNNIATHSQLHSNHRFHPFNQTNGIIGGSNNQITPNSNTAQNNNNNFEQQNQQQSNQQQQQMPETDCFFPTTNMLDYHLNSAAYIGDLSPTKCNDYQVNNYASSYYSSMQNYPLNTHHHNSSNTGQHSSSSTNSSLTSIPNAANFYNNPYGMLSQAGYMTGAYNNFTNHNNHHLIHQTGSSTIEDNNNLQQQLNAAVYHNTTNSAGNNNLSGSIDDYSQAVLNYNTNSNTNNNSQLNSTSTTTSQQAIQTYSANNNISTNSIQSQHSTHSHNNEQLIHSNSAHALLNSQTQLQQQQQQTHPTSNQISPSASNSTNSAAYYYPHLHSTHQQQQHNSNSTNTINNGSRTQQQATAASLLLHQHQISSSTSNYHSNQVQNLNSVTTSNQNNQNNASRETTTKNQLHSFNTAGGTCTASVNANNSSNSVNSSKNNSNLKSDDNTAIHNLTATTSTNTTTTTSTKLNKELKHKNLIEQKKSQLTSTSVPNSPSNNRSSPNLTANSISNSPILQSTNNNNELMNIGDNNKNFTNSSLLVDNLPDLDLISQQQQLNGQTLINQSQSISPLIVVNCNNSLSSNNSNCTTDDQITYHQHQLNNNSITDLNAHYQSQIAQMVESPKYSPNSDSQPTGVIKKMKTGRGRVKNKTLADSECSFKKIFVWDLDETLIMLSKLLNGTYANDNHKDFETGNQLAKKMESIIYTIARKHFLINNNYDDCTQYHIDEINLEENLEQNLMLNSDEYNQNNDNNLLNAQSNQAQVQNQSTVNNLNRSGNMECMNNLQIYIQQIKKIYLNYRNNFEALIDQTNLTNITRDNWQLLKEEINRFTDGWLDYIQECLKLIMESEKSINVLVSDSKIGLSLAKVLAYGLGPSFPIENIYSSNKIGKEQCFQRIKDKYGKQCVYLCVGGSNIEELAAKRLEMSYWRTDNNLSAIINFYYALKNFLLHDN